MSTRPPRLTRAWRVVSDAARSAVEDRAHRLAGSLAFYTAFALAPLLVMAIALVATVSGVEAAKQEVLSNVHALIGTGGSDAVEDLLEKATTPGPTAFTGLAAALLGSYGAMSTLRYALNVVCAGDAAGERRGLRAFVRATLRTLVLVPAVALVVAISLGAGLVVTGLTRLAGVDAGTGLAVSLAEAVVGILLVSTVVTIAYRFLPDADVTWRGAFVGAVSASMLLAIGRVALGAYVSRSTLVDAYAAAGSMTVILVWAYYASVSLVLGAEVTAAWGRSAPGDAAPAPRREGHRSRGAPR